jgi:hypothetical protein
VPIVTLVGVTPGWEGDGAEKVLSGTPVVAAEAGRPQLTTTSPTTAMNAGTERRARAQVFISMAAEAMTGQERPHRPQNVAGHSTWV